MYWSSPTRKRPPSMGQQSVAAAMTKIARATSAGRRGWYGPESECDTRVSPRESQERHSGPELGDRQQHPRGQRERRGRADPQRTLQHEDEQALAHPEPPGSDERQESRQVRRGEDRYRRAQAEARIREQPSR